MSVAFRTALLQALSLPTDEADPDSSSYERSSAKDVLATNVVLTKITQATSIDALAEIGQYITTHKDGYTAELLEQFRVKFKEQQANLIVPKFEEDTNETTTEEPIVTVNA
jgi:thermostable 8-oxoguanine DNA glycosylase